LREVVKPDRVTTDHNDVARARSALRSILAAMPGGAGPEDMQPSKACRAKKFRRVGDEVRYEIERHPGRGGTTHQTRAVSLLDGTEWIASQHVDVVTVAAIVGFAKRRASRQRTLDRIVENGARCGANYFRALLKCRQIKRVIIADCVEAIARGWVEHCARYAAIRGAWAGNVEHLLPLVREEDVALCGAANERARRIWGEVLWSTLP
jgi:hypothetical protein